MDSTTLAICGSCRKAPAGDIFAELLLCDQCGYRKNNPRKTARGAAKGSPGFTATILFVRHSESCANVLKTQKRPLSWTRSAYSDPELSFRGLAMAADKATKDAERLTGTPAIYGSSILYRAQQTIQKITNSSKGYIIFPYVNEVQPRAGLGIRGLSPSNNPADPAKIDAMLKGISKIDRTFHDRRLIEETPDHMNASLMHFMEWLGKSRDAVLDVNTEIRGEDVDKNNMRMVIVSHGLTIRALAKQLGHTLPVNNLDEIEVKVEYDADGNIVNTQFVADRPYTPDATIPAQCSAAETTCRKPVCSSTTPLTDAQKDTQYQLLKPAWFRNMGETSPAYLFLESERFDYTKFPNEEPTAEQFEEYFKKEILDLLAEGGKTDENDEKAVIKSKIEHIEEGVKYLGIYNIDISAAIVKAYDHLGLAAKQARGNEYIITGAMQMVMGSIRRDTTKSDDQKKEENEKIESAYNLLKNQFFKTPQGGELTDEEKPLYTQLGLEDNKRQFLKSLVDRYHVLGKKRTKEQQDAFLKLLNILKAKLGITTVPKGTPAARRRASRKRSAAHRGRKTRRYR